MGLISAFFNAYQDIEAARNMINSGDAMGLYKANQRKSFAKGAMDSTLQFACLASDTIPIDMATVLRVSLERVYASFIQSYLSLNSTVDISKDSSPSQFLKRFHSNINLESTAEDVYKEYCVESDEEYDKMMERIYDGTSKAYINENTNEMILFNFNENFNSAVFEAHKEQLEESLKYIDFTPFPNVSNSPYYEALDARDIHDLQMDAARAAIKANNDRANDAYKLQWNDKYRVPTMTDNDVKKTNDMAPYMMQVRLMAVNDQKEFVQFMDFVIGIKVVLHPMKSDEMITNIQSCLDNGNFLFNMIRWTTGEKDLFKDIILNANNVKLDVANRSKGASPWWMTLKRLKDTARLQKARFARNQLIPNSTIIVGSYEVDTLKQKFGYSLKDVRFAKKLMDQMFLMTFIIVDDATRTVDVLYDGQNHFQTYALETFEREVSMNSNRIGKELTRMISR